MKRLQLEFQQMAAVKFTGLLKRFFPDLKEETVSCSTIRDLVCSLDEIYPGISGYLVTDNGELRQHVNVFINEEMIKDRESLSDAVAEDDQIYIIQALSGG